MGRFWVAPKSRHHRVSSIAIAILIRPGLIAKRQVDGRLFTPCEVSPEVLLQSIVKVLGDQKATELLNLFRLLCILEDGCVYAHELQHRLRRGTRTQIWNNY